MATIKRIRCFVHGDIILSQEQYDKQMNKPNQGWSCPFPDCYTPAQWVGEYYECHCHTLIELGIDVCPNCGFDHYQAYLDEQEKKSENPNH